MKVEQEPEEVSTVVSGKVVVSAMGSARIVDRHQLMSEKKSDNTLLAKARTDSAAKTDGARQKKKLPSTRSDLSKIAAVKQDKATKQRKETVRKAPKSSKPPMKKKRLI